MKNKFVFYFILILMVLTTIISVGAVSDKEGETVARSVYNGNRVALGGEIIGIKLFTDGILVIDVGSVETKNGSISPGKNAGIKKGDYIISVDNQKVKSSAHFSELIKGKESVRIKIKRQNKNKELILKPYINKETKITKAGIWVRDSSAGIGTVTYYDTEKNTFGALGHPVTDTDTNAIFTISDAEAFFAQNFRITKGSYSDTGEITASFGNQFGPLGSIEKNNENGIFGRVTGNINKEYIPFAGENEIKEGDAFLVSNLKGEKKEKYSVKITKVIRGGDNKINAFTLKVTDKELLALTGGIVQGMSGSPVVQNGKLVGAVTHVFIKNPTKGYGKFIGDMLSETH